MNKLLSVIVAAMFAVVSASAFAAPHAGAQTKDEKKTEKKDAKKEKKKEVPMPEIPEDRALVESIKFVKKVAMEAPGSPATTIMLKRDCAARSMPASPATWSRRMA